MEKNLALITTLTNLYSEKAKKETAVEKRREQLESSSKASDDKKTKYYLSEKKRNREKYEALLEKAKADYEKYEAYCDAHLDTAVNEDSDKVITGLKFDVKTISDKIEETEKQFEEAQRQVSLMVRERIASEQKELDAIRAREMRLIYGPSCKEKQVKFFEEKKSDDLHPATRYLKSLEEPEEPVDKEKEKEEYVKQFEDFKPAPVMDPERKLKAQEALKAKKKFEADVKALLTPDEVAAFDDEFMEGCDKRKIYLMTVEEAKKAIQELAPDIKKLREFRSNTLNLSTDKDWDNFDFLKKGYQLEVVNRKCNRNDRDKLVKRLLKKRD